MRQAETKFEKMIKVDHAGENGAVNIYRGQKFIAHFRAPSLLPDLTEFQLHEERHHKIFSQYLNSRGIRRCISYHLCGAGGLTLGIVTGLLGKQAIYATTFAVENVVLNHLEHQLHYLESVDVMAFECVNEIVLDEQEHHDAAYHNLNQESRLGKVLIAIVKACTESVIRFGMR